AEGHRVRHHAPRVGVPEPRMALRRMCEEGGCGVSEREITHSVRLTDEELALLDGKCRPEVQKEVAAALDRLKARELHKDLPPALAGFVADVVSEARENGRLVYSYTELGYCPLCRKTAGYYRFQKGP